MYYNELRIAPEECNVLFLEHECISHTQKEKITQINFETFNVVAMQSMLKTISSLYANGRTTGVVLQVGAGATSVTPVYDGHRISNGSSSRALGGETVTRYLENLLLERGFSTETNAGMFHIINTIKHNNCYVALDFENEMNKHKSSTNSLEGLKEYELPDGQIIKTITERFIAPEVLFNPILLKREDKGLSHIIFDAISKCDLDIRLDMYRNVVLSGGSCRLPGIII